MSAQQVQRLQTLLGTVQRNRQRPGEPIGTGGNLAAANVVQKKSPANTTAAADPPRARVATPELPTGQIAAPPKPGAAAPARPAQREAPAVPTAQAPVNTPAAVKAPAAAKPAVRAPEPQPVTREPIVPRVIEPDAPQPATRPIAQLVSKHAPVVDATFGAMLKRSLSLRPH